jgi:glycosyltransferase involved in cell wall biosynthesis
MRVIQVLYSFGIGGSEIVGRDLALGMSHSGIECGVCALEGDGVLSRELRERGIETRVIARKPGEFLGAAWRLSSFFRAFRPDLVHTHHLHELVYAAFPARLGGVPIIHTEHETKSLQSEKAKGRLRILSRLCSFVTGVSPEVSRFLRDEVGIPPGKVRTIANGIRLEDFEPTRSVEDPHPGGALVLGTVARLTPLKDQKTLLEAFARLRQARSDLSLVLVGDGELRSELESLCGRLEIQQSVQFLGVRRDVHELLKGMDVFVLSSVSEGLPVALLEAMAAGPVVVATRVGSVPNLIRHGETGFLVDPGDPSALASCLEEVLERLPELGSVREEARGLIERDYSFEHTLSEYLSLYDAAIRGSGSA